MKDNRTKISTRLGLLAAFVLCASFAGCFQNGGNGLGILDKDDTEDAIELVSNANTDLKRIRVLYRDNASKVKDLEDALSKGDVKKVKILTDDLSAIINDGYVLAESAKEKLEKAQDLDINEDWKEYLGLKISSLNKQIKAFDYRRESAQLFRDKFGGTDKAQMARAAQIFRKNEENFEKYMKEAGDLSNEADQLAKDVGKK